MKIQDVMTRDPHCATPETSVRDAARIMRDNDIGIVPVVEDHSSRRLLGVVTDRDIAVRVVAEGRNADSLVSDAMSRDRLATCTADGDLDDAMDLMATEQVRRIPIVDERGTLVGIVAQADVVLKARADARAEETVERISEPGGPHSD